MATEKITKKHSKKSKIFIIVILLIVAFFIVGKIITSNLDRTVETETALMGTVENKTEADGFVIRKEVPVKSPATGVISFRADEDKRVSKGATIAVVFTGEVSDEVKTELSSLHARINEIEGSAAEKDLYSADSITSTMQIKNDISAVGDMAYLGEVSSVSEYKDDITRIIRKSDSGALTTLEQLVAKKQEIESKISGSAVEMYAPSAGILSSKLDGYESYFNINELKDITTDYIKNAKAMPVNDNTTVTKDVECLKIIDNYEWYFAANMDEKWCDDLKVGSMLSIRFPDISEEKLDISIYSMSEPKGGKIAVVFKGRGIFTGMYSTRETKAEIIRNTYNGFKVTKSAVHIDTEGKYYVFIKREGVVRRRTVQVLYSNDSYAVIKEDNSAQDNLLLYDEVIVSGNVEEGQAV